MFNVDDFIKEVLSHEEEAYDPAERRERYLRDRELKGRKTGGFQDTSIKNRRMPSPSPGNRKFINKPLPTKIDPSVRRKQIEAKVEELKNLLSKLKELLAKLVKEAKARSGIVEPEPEKSDNPKKPSEKSKLTDKEKAEAAKRAEEYREKHKDELLDKEVVNLTSKIHAIVQKIQEMRDKLATVSVEPVTKPSSDVLRKPGYDVVGPKPQLRKETGQNGRR